MFFTFSGRCIKKSGLERRGTLNSIIPSWVEYSFDYYEKSKREQKKLSGFWAIFSSEPLFPWLRLEEKKSHRWIEVLPADDEPEIIVNIAFPFKQHYTTLLSDKEIEIPSNLKVSAFKSRKYLTFKGCVTRTELIKLLMQVFSKAYGCSHDSTIVATLTD
jgi:hypothetical protein